MLSGPGMYAEHENNEVNFREIPWVFPFIRIFVDSDTQYIILVREWISFSSHVLQKVCQYFTYKVRYTNSATEIPEFQIAPEVR